MATLHANGARDALEKLVSYGVLAGENIAIPFVRRTVAAVTDLVVHMKRAGTRRSVDQIAFVPDQLSPDVFTVDMLFERRSELLTWTGTRPDDERLGSVRWSA